MWWQTQAQKKGKRKLHITAEKNWLRQSRKKAMTNRTKIINANSLHTVESLRRWASCCFSQPVSRMLATVLEWLTDFLTGAIMESRKAARSKAVASPPWSAVTIILPQETFVIQLVFSFVLIWSSTKISFTLEMCYICDWGSMSLWVCGPTVSGFMCMWVWLW